jgi:hypothetical protein
MPSNYNLPKEKTYRKLIPFFTVFAFILVASFIRQDLNNFNSMPYMMDFMGISFLLFGLFKLYDLQAFAIGFQEYDFIAKKTIYYGYLYPFLEIFLGLMYLFGFMFLWQNVLVLFLSLIGMITAYKYINNKEEIKCLCLGTMFNFPMTWVAFSENLLMFLMVIFMLAM